MQDGRQQLHIIASYKATITGLAMPLTQKQTTLDPRFCNNKTISSVSID